MFNKKKKLQVQDAVSDINQMYNFLYSAIYCLQFEQDIHSDDMERASALLKESQEIFMRSAKVNN